VTVFEQLLRAPSPRTLDPLLLGSLAVSRHPPEDVSDAPGLVAHAGEAVIVPPVAIAPTMTRPSVMFRVPTVSLPFKFD
jgi:hypothetical protein